LNEASPANEAGYRPSAGKISAAQVRGHGERKMKTLLAAISVAALIVTATASRAEEITRFAPLKADELSPAQKVWADMIAAPPRNAKFGGPPYRAYIRNPELAPRLSALSDYLRWNTTLPPRLSEFAILLTARQWTAI
jgi:4-carboxymuconolactone decarboxylase